MANLFVRFERAPHLVVYGPFSRITTTLFSPKEAIIVLEGEGFAGGICTLATTDEMGYWNLVDRTAPCWSFGGFEVIETADDDDYIERVG